MSNYAFIGFLIARGSVSLANTILSVCIGWHIYQATGNAFDLAMVGLMQVIPALLFFVVTGWVVDNFSRKKILIICAIAEAIVFVALAMVMQGEELQRFAIFSLLLVHGTVKAFFAPAQQAILPAIVDKDRLSQAVAISSSVWNTAMTGGPFIAGFLISWIDLQTYWLLGFLSLVAAGFYSTIPPLVAGMTGQRGRDALLSGIRFIKANPVVLGSMSLDLFIMLVGSVTALLPMYVTDVLKAGPETLGALRAMSPLGAVMMGITLSRLPQIRYVGYTLFSVLAVFAIAILVFALTQSYVLSLLALWVYGAADMVSVNIRQTLIQLGTPDHLRGRVSAVNSIFISSSNHVADFRAGTVAALLGPVNTILLGGFLALGVVAGGFMLFPGLRRLDHMREAEYWAKEAVDKLSTPDKEVVVISNGTQERFP